jgi:hypothetical protein
MGALSAQIVRFALVAVTQVAVTRSVWWLGNTRWPGSGASVFWFAQCASRGAPFWPRHSHFKLKMQTFRGWLEPC